MTIPHQLAEALTLAQLPRLVGPEEKRLRNRMYCWAHFGRWPQVVAHERLRLSDERRAKIKQLIQEAYESL